MPQVILNCSTIAVPGGTKWKSSLSDAVFKKSYPAIPAKCSTNPSTAGDTRRLIEDRWCASGIQISQYLRVDWGDDADIKRRGAATAAA